MRSLPSITAFVLSLLLLAVTAQTTETIFVNEGTLSGLTINQVYPSGDVEERTVGCNSGTCLRIDNGVTQGYIYRYVDTSGYIDVSISTVVKTTSIENGEGCGIWWTNDYGVTWQLIWIHMGGDEIGWTLVTLDNAAIALVNGNVDIDNSPGGGLKFGTVQTGGSADYCWTDRVEVVGTTGNSPPPPSTPPPPPPPPPGTDQCAGCLAPSVYDTLSGDGTVANRVLTAGAMWSGATIANLVSYDEMRALEADIQDPTFSFEGHLSLPLVASETPIFEKVYDQYNYDSDAARLHLPSVEFDLIQHGSHIIPTTRGFRESTHPYWEVAVEAGRCWSETADAGATRCSLPFALAQRNSNCVHNGVLTFLFEHDSNGNGFISNVFHEIAIETCPYYKFNMHGFHSAVYTRESVAGAADIRTAYAAEVTARIPLKTIDDIDNDYPGANNGLIYEVSASVTNDEVTMVGFYDGTTHYAYIGRKSREISVYGYPHKHGLILPSYSTAKTHFFAASLLALKQAYPNVTPDPFAATVGALTGADANKWNDVTVQNVADMATGNYRFDRYEVDEGSVAMTNDFFLQESHLARIAFAEDEYARMATPGSTWVYHSSDHYLGLNAAQEWLRSASGNPTASILDFMVTTVWGPMGGSDVLSNSRVTRDSYKQPFGAYGLFYLPNDVALLSGVFGSGKLPDNTQVFHAGKLAEALGTDCVTGCGIATSSNFSPSIYYQSALWKKQDGWCQYLPFASGFGGITIAQLPTGGSYHYFSDNGEYDWSTGGAEILRITGTCP